MSYPVSREALPASDVLALVDVDRTLVPTHLVTRLYTDASRNIVGKIDSKAIDAQRDLLETSGKSFSPYAIVQKLVSPEDFARINDEFYSLTRKKDDAQGSVLLYRDTLPFLYDLAARKVPTVLLTYGVDEAWQALKLKAAGLDVWPHIITDRRDKGAIIREWQNPATGGYEFDRRIVTNRTYLAAQLAIRRIVLFDDKASSFHGLPEDGSAGGAWLRRLEEDRLPSQEGIVPNNVVEVNTLERSFDRALETLAVYSM